MRKREGVSGGIARWRRDDMWNFAKYKKQQIKGWRYPE
jgi:hypothetical protein